VSNNSIEERVRAEIASVKASISPANIAIGVVVFLALLCFAPFFLILLPFAIAGMAVLYWVGTRTESEAKNIAKERLGPDRKSDVNVAENIGIADALVLNDWGIVISSPGKKPVEIAWDKITLVEEPRMGTLLFHTIKGERVEVDLWLHRYLLLTEAINKKLPGKTDFDIDAATGESKILQKLATRPLEWKSKNLTFRVTEHGIKFSEIKIAWQDITSVVETEQTVEDAPSVWYWEFAAGGALYEVDSAEICAANSATGCSGDQMKAIVAERIPDKTQFIWAAPTANDRAYQEFERCREATKAAFALALGNGNFDRAVEPMFQHMLNIVDRFSLDNKPHVQEFFMHYAELFKLTGRPEESERLLARVTQPIRSPSND
jgi:hypothetical protein